MPRFVFANIFFLLSINSIYAQKPVNLIYVLNEALINSDRIKNIEDKYTIRKKEYHNFKKSFLPQVILSTSIPYQRSIDEVPQFNGSSIFLERQFTNASINLITTQAVPFTGGDLILTNSINRFDDIRNGVKSYSSNWIDLLYSQPINGFNDYKWQRKKSELLKIKDAFEYEREVASFKKEVVELYLDGFILQMKIELTSQNIETTTRLLNDYKEKEKYARVLGIDVKQVQITLNQLNQKFENDQFELSVKLNDLKRLMDRSIKDTLILKEVKKVEFLKFQKEDLIKAFLKYNYELDSKIQLLEADKNIDRAKKEEAISFFIQLGIGLNSNSSNFENLYNKPTQRQFLSLGATIPLLNWGRLENNKDIAKLEKNILERNLDDIRFSVEKKAIDLFNYYQSLLKQIKISEKELSLHKETNELFYEMLLLNRKTIYEYKDQIIDYEKSIIRHHQLLKNFILLEFVIDEFVLN